ncbi:hypothetical protein D5085_09730 [Ectothiorhodospiraceae bacterium BW-2]|nr:hypothetical protein D5085_09730 [Ectothiorhodospiraceae bacterium BW-2]
MKYQNHHRNHAIVPGRESALDAFIQQDYKGMRHKLKNAYSSNSEDALTWSCFDTLEHLPSLDKIAALDEILFDAYGGAPPVTLAEKGLSNSDVTIHIGKRYDAPTLKESTEVDASIEAPNTLIFIEAKLYSAISPAQPPKKPHDQIARKLRVGIDSAKATNSEFYFIFLDIAPLEKMNQRRSKSEVMEGSGSGYHDKWKSAWLFSYYKKGRANSLKPLEEALTEVADKSAIPDIAANMGWLTWADLFKCTLRATLNATST